LGLEPLEHRLLLDSGLGRLVDDAFDFRQNSAARRLDVLANDVFDDGYTGKREITAVSYGTEGGRIQLSTDRDAIQYAPPADYSGTETFVYFVDNALSATVTITISSPLAPDTYEIPPDGDSRILDVLANDPFGTGYDGPGEITSVSETSIGGEATIADDGKSIVYTPPTEAYGEDAFVYIVDGIYPAKVTIDVPNPLENDRYREIVQSSDGNVLEVLANDVFWPGYEGARRITFVSEPTDGGSVSIEEDGRAVVYSPADDDIGWDHFTYVVDNLYEAPVDLQVHRPVRDDWFEVDTNTTDYRLTVLKNDVFSYSEGGSRITRDVVDRVTSVGQPDHGGTAVITADGQGVLYSAPPDFEGPETFEYVADGKHRATVTVKVTSPARDDFIHGQVFEDTVGHILNVLSNDFRGNGYGGPRMITSVGPTSEGAIVGIVDDGRSVSYTPPAGFIGTDSFTYAVDNELEAEVRVQVGSIAEGDYFRECPDPSLAAYALHVLGNDHFGVHYPGSGVITAVGETANGGIAEIAANGQWISFIPAEGGADSFTYTVDGKYQASVSVSFRSYLTSDSFVVDQNTAGELAPLENDFRHTPRGCSSYAGPRLITSVGASEHGGTVTVAADGQTVHYAPPPDFAGDDSFTYTVDALMQSTVTVHVIRRVRDDVFRVAPGSHENMLAVLVNDLFGANYSGAGRITDAGETAAGASVTVSDDGGSIYYTPPAGFSGGDKFTYTVDSALKAEVEVWVGDSGMDALPRFGSSSQFQQFLMDDALERYEGLFGQNANYSYDIGDSVSLAENKPFERNHSETNVQVAEVDEGDIIETDGDYLYILRDAEFVIADAWPADQLSIVSRAGIEGSAVAEYLHGDRLTVISQIWDDDWRIPYPTHEVGFVATDWWPWPRSRTTWVTVFDVTDRESPELVQKTKLDGTYVESRRIDDFVFLVLRNKEIQLPAPKWTCGSEEDAPAAVPAGQAIPVVDPTTTCAYESREDYIERMETEMGSILDSMLPHYTSYGPDGELVRTGLLNAPEDLFQPLSPDGKSLVSVASLNMSGDEPGLAASAGVLTSGADKIYGSRDNLYVFDDEYTAEDGPTTRIMKFDWNSETGDVEFVAKGQVAGRMLNQFSADEHDGYLRIATTVSNSYCGNWSGRSENVLFVLSDDAGVLEFVGGIQNLALDETIRSVRFMGDRAFATTFRQFDPLFALDVSDPANPMSVGHVTMPGFNSYMQFVDETRILAVGRNTPIGTTGPTQVSLFDVSDLSQPRLIDRHTFERFSTSEAEADHHAFGWFREHDVLAMPSERGYWQRVDEDGDGYRETRTWVREDELFLFEINVAATVQQGDGIRLRGQIGHESPVRRSVYIDNVLYSVAEDSVQAVSIADPTVLFAHIQLGDEPEASSIDDSAHDVEEIVANAIQTATVNLAESKGMDRKAVLAITAEAAVWGAGCIGGESTSCGISALPGFRVVLEVGDDRYLYHTDTGQDVRLMEESFRFEPPEYVWHNQDCPEDVNRDSLVTPLDALIAIGELNDHGPRRLSADLVLRQIDYAAESLIDVNGDECITPLDVLIVANRLTSLRANGGDSAAEGEWPYVILTSTSLVSPENVHNMNASPTHASQDGQSTERDRARLADAIVTPGTLDDEIVLDDIAGDVGKQSAADSVWEFGDDLLEELF